MMRQIVYISTKTSMGFNEILQLPYAIFLGYLKQLWVLQMEETQEGRDALYKESAIHQTEPDLGRLRQLNGYQAKGVD
ncbi:hypothetical protein [Tissierella pigra]|uniref:hypothetical protein n=1 Tax=Tissierella pigra TaxID=2607614 RepID=UPI0018A6B87B|nr:hypothetical protein [Tissierella pigra]